MPTFVTYFRVSTDRQGKSGLGLEAQRASVMAYLAGIPDSAIVAEFTEVESGSKSDRPQLTAALATCKRLGATLVIAKLDRLARNVHFVSGLMESGVEFVAADMPHANRFMIHIMAAVSEQERLTISKRTKEALQAAKARGQVLGNPRPDASLARGRQTILNQATYRHQNARQHLRPMMEQLRREGLTYRAIADVLNTRGIKSTTGARWYGASVGRILTMPIDEPHPSSEATNEQQVA